MKQIVIKNLPATSRLIKKMKLASPHKLTETCRDPVRSAIVTVLRGECEDTGRTAVIMDVSEGYP
jgi:hypothetical protein